MAGMVSFFSFCFFLFSFSFLLKALHVKILGSYLFAEQIASSFLLTNTPDSFYNSISFLLLIKIGSFCVTNASI